MPLDLYEDELSGVGISAAPSSIQAPVGIGVAPQSIPMSGDAAGSEVGGVADQPGSQWDGLMGMLQKGLFGSTSGEQARISQGKLDRELKVREMDAGIKALKEGVDLSFGLEGDKKSTFVKAYKQKLDDFEPGLGDAFETLSANPEIGGSLMEWAQESPTLKRAFQAGGLKGAKKLLTSPDALKTIQSEIDTGRMPILLRKGQAFLTGWQQLVSPEMAEAFNEDGRLSASELIRANEWIKANKPDIAKTLAFSDRELEIVARNSDAFYHSLGIVSPKDEGSILVDDAKGKNKGKPPPGRTIKKTGSDGKVLDQPQVWKDGKWVDEGEATPHHKPDDTGPGKEVKDLEAKILLKISRGEQLTPEDRAFMDEKAKTNPVYAAMRDAIGGGASPRQEPAPAELKARFAADPKMKGNTLGTKKDKGWEVKDSKGKVVGYYK